MINQKMKNDEDFERLRQKLRSALPPAKKTEPLRDLWPLMLQRMKRERGRAWAWPLRVPWFDWALLAGAGAALVFFPALIPALLYHL